MNPKKRLKMSLNGERVDRPPCICPGGMMNMVTAELMERVGIYLPEAHTDARKMADLHVETIVHICGHMKNVYKEVNEVHSNALSFDSAVPMMDARKNLADRVLMGNVSTYTLEFGSEEAVRRLAGNCIKCGSDIVSPACGLGMSSPLRNIQALLSSVEESDG